MLCKLRASLGPPHSTLTRQNFSLRRRIRSTQKVRNLPFSSSENVTFGETFTGASSSTHLNGSMLRSVFTTTRRPFVRAQLIGLKCNYLITIIQSLLRSIFRRFDFKFELKSPPLVLNLALPPLCGPRGSFNINSMYVKRFSSDVKPWCNTICTSKSEIFLRIRCLLQCNELGQSGGLE